MKYPDIFDKSIQDKWKAKEDEWIQEQAEKDAKYAAYSDEEAKAASDEVTKEALERSDKVFKEIKAVEAEMEAKIKKEKGDDADLVYDGYNKANLLADYEKSHKKDSKTESKKEASEAKKADSSQTLWIVIGLLLAAVLGVFGYKQVSKKKEDS